MFHIPAHKNTQHPAGQVSQPTSIVLGGSIRVIPLDINGKCSPGSYVADSIDNVEPFSANRAKHNVEDPVGSFNHRSCGAMVEMAKRGSAGGYAVDDLCHYDYCIDAITWIPAGCTHRGHDGSVYHSFRDRDYL